MSTVVPRIDPGELTRTIGTLRGDTAGPCLIVVGAIHGNEPAGVLALRRVFDRLRDHQVEISGDFVGLLGNIRAFQQGLRYLDRDLNRLWQPDDRADADSCAPSTCRDYDELLDLRTAVRSAQGAARGRVFVLDLHTTSSPTVPFAIANDRRANRRFAAMLPVPIALGLQEELGGTLMEYVEAQGCTVIAFEAGRHDDPLAVDRHEAAIWLMLTTLGMIPRVGESPPSGPGDLDGFTNGRAGEILAGAVGGLPRRFEVRYRHPVSREDEFTMQPDFRNFDPVSAGDTLAFDRGGAIRAIESARIFLPLYQGLGAEGFCLVRPVSKLRVALGLLLRGMRFDAVIPWLPGAHRHPACRHTVLVNPHLARGLTGEILHLSGYRRHPTNNGLAVFRRRADGFPPAID